MNKSWLALLLVDPYARRRRRRRRRRRSRTRWRPYSKYIDTCTDMQPWFTVYFFDIEHPIYGQLTPVKTRRKEQGTLWMFVLLYLTSWLRPSKSRPIKLCADSSRDPVPPRTSGHLSDHTLSGVLTLTVLDPAMLVGNRDISLGIVPPNGNCSWNA